MKTVNRLTGRKPGRSSLRSRLVGKKSEIYMKIKLGNDEKWEEENLEKTGKEITGEKPVRR